MNSYNIALVGNPNTGKSSLFNILTGLNQKIGNYHGVTVDKKEGFFKHKNKSFSVLDLPGLYSLYPQSITEEIATKYILKPAKNIDKIIFIADASNIKRNLFLLSQIRDLGYNNIILCLNMVDVMKNKGIKINTNHLEEKLGIDIVEINAKTGKGINDIKELISKDENKTSANSIDIISKIKEDENYKDLESTNYKDFIQSVLTQESSSHQVPIYKNIKKILSKEAIERYKYINYTLDDVISEEKTKSKFAGLLDNILLHKIWGYVIFLIVLFTIFQAIYTWSSYPMDLIDQAFSDLSSFLSANMGDNTLSNLITEGIIPGIAGVVIFVPQITILFFIITIIEDIGYMDRIVFIMNRIMRIFGLNGKSLIPIISGIACAIPAIMACRNIEDNRIRNITIMALPFMTCSARLPVYVIIIGLVIPEKEVIGMNLQGIVLLCMYLLGVVFTVITSLVISKFTKKKKSSPLIFELPSYKLPNIRNLLYSVLEKSKVFVINAGKIIFALSIIIWFMSSYSPNSDIIEQEISHINKSNDINEEEKQNKIASIKLEHSYMGIMGKYIEPIVSPLGYDWKIGIALLASISAREVFVGTISTIYSVGQDDNEALIRDKMKNEINPITGQPIYNLAVGMSLMVFYALSMQCISTIAIVRRETKSWKFATLQFVFMTVIAYIFSFLTYNIFI